MVECTLHGQPNYLVCTSRPQIVPRNPTSQVEVLSNGNLDRLLACAKRLHDGHMSSDRDLRLDATCLRSLPTVCMLLSSSPGDGACFPRLLPDRTPCKIRQR